MCGGCGCLFLSPQFKIPMSTEKRNIHWNPPEVLIPLRTKKHDVHPKTMEKKTSGYQTSKKTKKKKHPPHLPLGWNSPLKFRGQSQRKVTLTYWHAPFLQNQSQDSTRQKACLVGRFFSEGTRYCHTSCEWSVQCAGGFSKCRDFLPGL